MICKNCGREIINGTMFCAFCGVRIDGTFAAPGPQVAAEPLKQYNHPGFDQMVNPATLPSYATTYGVPVQPPYTNNYGAVQPIQGPPMNAQTKSKSKIWIIALVVSLLVLCCCSTVSGIILFGTIENASKVVVVDNDMVKITIDTKSYSENSDSTYRSYEATIENKTSGKIFMFFSDDTKAEGVSSSAKFYIAPASGNSIEFAANKKTNAQFLINGKITGDITNFQGTLLVYGSISSETIGEFEFDVAEL